MTRKAQPAPILNTDKQEDTRWSIVYDIPARKVHFRFHKCRQENTTLLKQLEKELSLHYGFPYESELLSKMAQWGNRTLLMQE